MTIIDYYKTRFVIIVMFASFFSFHSFIIGLFYSRQFIASFGLQLFTALGLTMAHIFCFFHNSYTEFFASTFILVIKTTLQVNRYYSYDTEPNNIKWVLFWVEGRSVKTRESIWKSSRKIYLRSFIWLN